MANAFHLYAFEERERKNWYLFFCTSTVQQESKQATETCNCLVNKNMNYTRLHSITLTIRIHIIFLLYSLEFNLDEAEKNPQQDTYNLKSNRYSVLYNYARQLSVFVKLRRNGQKIDITKKRTRKWNCNGTKFNSVKF